MTSPERSGEDNVRNGRCRSEEELFELGEGSLEPDRERAARSHLWRCPACRERYEQGLSLDAALPRSGARPTDAAGNRDLGVRGGNGTARSVVMAIPTRSPASRVVWGVGAGALLLAALASLTLYLVQPVWFVTRSTGALWGVASGASDAVGVALAVSGPTVLVALAAGALADGLIALTLLAVARWWRPRGA